MTKSLDRMTRDIESIRKTLNHLTQPVLGDLERRARIPVESDHQTGGGGPKAKGSHSDPTLAAVMRSMSRPTKDPIYEAVRDIATSLADMAQLAIKIQDRLRYVTTLNGTEGATPAVVYCQACEREVACTPRDRLRSGYCFSCYRKWTTRGRPYRTKFEVEIKTQN